MAKHVIAETYTFNPALKQIIINNRYLRQEQLMLITNTTRNTVIYNFSDPTLGATVTNVYNTTTAQPTCTILLNYNTAAHSSTDKISILVEETAETFVPTEVLYDPVNKLRVSNPQALIDTDFEYSTQSTKWESVNLINNRPFAYYNVFNPLSISDVTAVNNSRTITVTTSSAHGFSAGSPIFIQDTLWSGADGLFMIDSTPTSTTFTYTARYLYTGASGSLFVANTTVGYQGFVFTGAAIPISNMTYSGALITVTTTGPHGFCIGNEFGITGLTASTNAPNGSFVVATVTSPTVFQYYASGTPTGTIGFGSANLYVRPQGNFLHRPFDGGVTFSTNASSHNQQLIRQTRRYFRYQSGKGMQMSTGTIMKPNIIVDQIISSGTTVTVYTKYPHNIQPSSFVTISGCNESAYNGTFPVLYVIDPYRIQYIAASVPSAATASGNYTLSIASWFGGATRLGMFDSQNGIFFEFDGQQMFAVRRSSTYQISGWISVNAGSNTVTGQSVNGVSTVFSKQLLPGDFVVIKGMSYRIDSIASDTSLTIIPAYRGATNLTLGIMSKTIDTRIPQSSWNIDRCDGTGISGFNLDLTRMQMFYLDYSWYGAGFIRWGFRGSTGDVVYGHKLPNNNVNYEAYMRSGNLPARYETNTFPKYTSLAASVAISDTTITVASTSGFNTSGSIVIRNSNGYEYVNYTGITATQFTGCTRGQTGATITVQSTTLGSPVVLSTNTGGLQPGMYVFGTGIPPGAYIISIVAGTSITLSMAAVANGTNVSLVFAPMGVAATTHTYSATNPICVEQHAPLFASTISHWGTSVIIDGRFDEDKSYVFSRGMVTSLAVSGNTTNAVMSLRIAPSVGGGITASTLGSRELVNRMQLVLRQLDVFSNGSFLITMILNGIVSSATPNWVAQGGSSLCQYIFHTPGTTVSGGEVVYGFYLNSTGSTAGTTTQQDLTLVRDLGTSILSGGAATANTNVFPDGPDIITIVAQNLVGQSGNLQARLSWTEAQA